MVTVFGKNDILLSMHGQPVYPPLSTLKCYFHQKLEDLPACVGIDS